MPFDLDALGAAEQLVRRRFPPTACLSWPLLRKACGAEVWVKHENHTPIGAFKIRGGVVYMDWLKRARPEVRGVISATRGNHGQSLALAGLDAGLEVTVLVPSGNSGEKNEAMRAFGARLIERGSDFDEAAQEAGRLADQEGLHMVPSFDPHLVRGVATYALEMFRTVAELDVVYVPIGLGSGVCGVIGVRDLLGLKTEVVGVVAKGAPAYARSFRERALVPSNEARTFADGMAVRVPNSTAMAIIQDGCARVVEVSDDEIAEAVRLYYRATHNLAEGAGAAPLAALMQERSASRGKCVGVILSGGNIDRDWYATILAGGTPVPR